VDLRLAFESRDPAQSRGDRLRLGVTAWQVVVAGVPAIGAQARGVDAGDVTVAGATADGLGCSGGTGELRTRRSSVCNTWLAALTGGELVAVLAERLLGPIGGLAELGLIVVGVAPPSRAPSGVGARRPAQL
jgi:hypothetical protein